MNRSVVNLNISDPCRMHTHTVGLIFFSGIWIHISKLTVFLFISMRDHRLELSLSLLIFGIALFIFRLISGIILLISGIFICCLLISFRCIFRLSIFFLLFIGTVSFICSIIFLCTIRFFFLFCISLSCFYRCRLFFHCLFLS